MAPLWCIGFASRTEKVHKGRRARRQGPGQAALAGPVGWHAFCYR